MESYKKKRKRGTAIIEIDRNIREKDSSEIEGKREVREQTAPAQLTSAQSKLEDRDRTIIAVET